MHFAGRRPCRYLRLLGGGEDTIEFSFTDQNCFAQRHESIRSRVVFATGDVDNDRLRLCEQRGSANTENQRGKCNDDKPPHPANERQPFHLQTSAALALARQKDSGRQMNAIATLKMQPVAACRSQRATELIGSAF
ncbi:MAG: hypothetical protein M3O82_06375 [Verrucomicrobiota bacterium]|nr:hypothetical protein [Verrucomicrobiota bacterium]